MAATEFSTVGAGRGLLQSVGCSEKKAFCTDRAVFASDRSAELSLTLSAHVQARAANVASRRARAGQRSTVNGGKAQPDSTSEKLLVSGSGSKAGAERRRDSRLTTGASSDAVVLDSGGGTGGSSGASGGDGSGGGGEGAGDMGGQGRGGIFVALWDAIARGWKERVDADPEFAFKVMTEQLIGVSACVAGDMASRPNFGLNELDFVFSTLVVGSILNFSLMYLLAPVASSSSVALTLPGIFSSCPPGHMFEPGSYSLAQRAGTFLYKGAQFAVVGFAAGLVGTLISNLLLDIRKRMQPGFELQNEPPAPFLNAATWGLHLGVSSNFRYQALNGLDLFIAKALPPSLFRAFVFAIRGANNIIGGSTFVMLAKVTGAQKSQGPEAAPHNTEPPPSEECCSQS